MDKGVEFDPFKIRVVQLFPKAKKLDGAAAAHPVFNHILGLVGIFVTGDVGQGNEIVFVSFGQNGDFRALGINGRFHLPALLKPPNSMGLTSGSFS